MFSGDSDLNGRVTSMPWSRWSLTVRRYFGELSQTATRLLQWTETNVEDPIITDHTTMTGGERRLSAQLCCVLALTCRKRALQVVQQVPRGYWFESWRQLCRKFGPHPPVRSLWNAPSPFVVRNQQSQSGWSVSGETEERSARNSRATRCLTGSQQDRRRGIVARQETAEFLRARQVCAVSGDTITTDLVLSGR